MVVKLLSDRHVLTLLVRLLLNFYKLKKVIWLSSYRDPCFNLCTFNYSLDALLWVPYTGFDWWAILIRVIFFDKLIKLVSPSLFKRHYFIGNKTGISAEAVCFIDWLQIQFGKSLDGRAWWNWNWIVVTLLFGLLPGWREKLRCKLVKVQWVKALQTKWSIVTCCWSLRPLKKLSCLFLKTYLFTFCSPWFLILT